MFAHARSRRHWMVSWSGKCSCCPRHSPFHFFGLEAPRALASALVASGYFLAASRGLPQGVATYYAADLWPGLAALASCIGLVRAGPHCCFGPRARRLAPTSAYLAAISHGRAAIRDHGMGSSDHRGRRDFPWLGMGRVLRQRQRDWLA
jgi:hypothetical protein